jgi:hypothetical protein
MKATAILLLYLLTLVLLIGCSPGYGKDKESVKIGEAGFITDLADGKKVLIKDTYYRILDKTSIKNSNGNTLGYKNLKIGMKAKVWYEGDIEETLPGRANARLIMIQTDKQSLKEQEVVTSAISSVQKGQSQRFFVRKVTYLGDEDVYQLEMMSRSNPDSSFTVTVDAVSHEILYQE